MAKLDAIAGLEALGGTGKGFPAGGVDAHMECHGYARPLAAFAGPETFELRRDHLGVVKDQCVAGLEQIRQVKHTLVAENRICICVDNKHARTVARIGWSQRNVFLRQVEVEQVYTHGLYEFPASYGGP